MLVVLAAVTVLQAIMFAVGMFSWEQYYWLPIITGLGLVMSALIVFVLPRLSKRSYINYFAQMKAHPDKFEFHGDRVTFEEGAPILPEGFKLEQSDLPKGSGEKMNFPFAAVRFLEVSGDKIVFRVRGGRIPFVFIISRESADNTENFDRATAFIREQFCKER